MVQNDPLADAMHKIAKYDALGRESVDIVNPNSMLKRIVKILNELGYLGSFDMAEDGKGGIMTLHLLKKINACGVIKPRYPIKVEDFEKWEKRYLLAQGFGVLLLSTNQGLMTHEQALKQNIGGTLVAFCY